MTLAEFKAALLVIDSGLDKYASTKTGNYTTWSPGNLAGGLNSDDEREEDDQRVYVDRYTKSDTDTVATAIMTMLRENRIPYDYVHIYEQETKYIHHSFTCIVG